MNKRCEVFYCLFLPPNLDTAIIKTEFGVCVCDFNGHSHIITYDFV